MKMLNLFGNIFFYNNAWKLLQASLTQILIFSVMILIANINFEIFFVLV